MSPPQPPIPADLVVHAPAVAEGVARRAEKRAGGARVATWGVAARVHRQAAAKVMGMVVEAVAVSPTTTTT